MSVSDLNHYTIRCIPEDLPQLLHFYTKYLQLTLGFRPPMSFPGCWLYCRDQAIVHLAAFLSASEQRSTGSLDHISFRAHGLADTRALLSGENVAFDEAPVLETTLHQLFLRDPKGLKIELTFDLAEENGADSR